MHYSPNNIAAFLNDIFFLSTGQGAVSPCIAVFAKDRLNLSPTSFAILTMVQQFTLVPTKPMIGYIVDYFNKLKLVIYVLTIAYMACFLLLLLVPAIPKVISPDRNELTFKIVDFCDLYKKNSIHFHEIYKGN